ncbi:MAG TPA: AAA family ATPase [Pirellulales bacterium]|nr:AAA family ATPase [Pirellulales bacterium]
MNVVFQSGRYKSIVAPFKWNGIPNFAVLTGPNGAGKTQILQLISDGIAIPGQPQKARLDGFPIKREEALFIRKWELGGDHLATQDSVSKALMSYYRGEFRKNQGGRTVRIQQVVQKRTGKSLSVLTEDEILNVLPPEALFQERHGFNAVLSGLAQACEHYYLARLELILSACEAKQQTPTEEQIIQAIGVPPWQQVNRLLSAAGIELKFNSPEGTGLKVIYKLRIIGPQGVPILPNDLSSGEMTLVGLILLFFNSRHNGIVPKLLLLDEPDAHLHPAVIRSFYHGLRDVIGKEFGCRIVATTHRPDTVALLNREELFEVFPTGERIRPVRSIEATLARLSANLVAVLKNTRCVLVEDEDDVIFYNIVRDLIASETETSLDPLPVFQPASTGMGKDKVAGGCTVVGEWVKKLAASGLGQLLHGVIDRDRDNPSTDNVHLLPRHSIENYIFDPLVVYECLLNQSKPPLVEGVSLVAGESCKIKELPNELLQRIVDHISQPVLAKINDGSAQSMTVTFTNGKVVNYSTVFRDKRGHDLSQRVYEVHQTTRPQLLEAMKRLRLVPKELVDMFQAIIGPVQT